jgi:hypothetical protein
VCVRQKLKVLGMGVKICMGIEGPRSVNKSPCGSREAHVSQEFTWESKGTCKMGIKGRNNGGENPCGSRKAHAKRKSMVLKMRVRIRVGVKGPKNANGSPCEHQRS